MPTSPELRRRAAALVLALTAALAVPACGGDDDQKVGETDSGPNPTANVNPGRSGTNDGVEGGGSQSGDVGDTGDTGGGGGEQPP